MVPAWGKQARLPAQRWNNIYIPPPSRSDRNAIWVPSGENVGSSSSAGSSVSRMGAPPSTCCTQMSRLVPSARSLRMPPAGHRAKLRHLWSDQGRSSDGGMSRRASRRPVAPSEIPAGMQKRWPPEPPPQSPPISSIRCAWAPPPLRAMPIAIPVRKRDPRRTGSGVPGPSPGSGTQRGRGPAARRAAMRADRPSGWRSSSIVEGETGNRRARAPNRHLRPSQPSGFLGLT